MSWVAWGVAAGLAWLVVAIVVSLVLGRRLKRQAPARPDSERVSAELAQRLRRAQERP